MCKGMREVRHELFLQALKSRYIKPAIHAADRGCRIQCLRSCDLDDLNDYADRGKLGTVDRACQCSFVSRCIKERTYQWRPDDAMVHGLIVY